MIAGVCRLCGCTDDRPCVIEPDDHEVDVADALYGQVTTCAWVEPDLCSAHDATELDAGKSYVFDAYCNPWRGGGQS